MLYYWTMNEKSQAVVAAIMLAMMGWIVTEQHALRPDVGDPCERMARLEGLLEGHVKGDCSE